MTAYRRDDGAEMVEWKPGFTIRRDVGLRLGLIAPEMRLGRGRSAALSPAADPQPERFDPPPLQPSHEDLVLAAPEPAMATTDHEAFVHQNLAAVAASVDLTYEQVVADWPAEPASPPLARKPRPARRSIAAILAEADRNHRAVRHKAKA